MAEAEPPADEPQAIQNIPQFRDLPFTRKQIRIVLSNCGTHRPRKNRRLHRPRRVPRPGQRPRRMSPEEVIRAVKESGLRGRGGGGFLDRRKWELCRKSPGDTKYVICNADEGDPGAFMDRSSSKAIRIACSKAWPSPATRWARAKAIIYCREEYPLAIDRLQAAIAQATDFGLLGTEHPRQPVQL